MRIAEANPLPRSILLGRPMPKPGEPLWLPDDVEWAIAYEQHKATICSDCGTDHAKWWEQRDPYVAIGDRCPGREAIAIAEKNIPEDERAQGAFARLIPFDEWAYREEIKDAAGRLGLMTPLQRRRRDVAEQQPDDSDRGEG